MKKKLYIVSLMMLIIINMLSINVSALGFSVTMTPSSTKVNPGNEVVVSVKVSSLNVGDDGINTLSAALGYDATVFEVLSAANVEGSNSWLASYNPGTSRITLTKTSFVNSDEEICQISLKVKNDLDNGTKGTITLSNILAANPESEFSSSNVSTTITVGTENASDDGEDNEGNDGEDNTNEIIPVPSNIIINTNTTNNNAININNNTNDTTNNANNITNNTVNEIEQSEDDIPYAGPEDENFVRIILGLIIIALLIYRKIYSLEDI